MSGMPSHKSDGGDQHRAPYDHVAQSYDRTRSADPRLAGALYAKLEPHRGGRYLDLGCGTGNYLAELERLGLHMTGIDLSGQMLEIARSKAPQAKFVQARADITPFDSNSFDGCLCCLAIHHFDNLEAVAFEAYRILRDDGRFVIFTTENAQTERFWLNEYFPQLMQKNATLMPSATTIAHALKSAGFRSVELETWLIPEDMTDLFLYGGKHQPDVYLRQDVRHGITRFRNASRDDGVSEGCRRLERDIASGRINQVIASHPSSAGDYLFLAARK